MHETLAPTTPTAAAAVPIPMLDDLQTTLEREIPICSQLGIRVHEGGLDGLVMSMPLKPNLNHQKTAFAGSLSTLCTVAGWGYTFLLLKKLGRSGSVVIHRSTIKYMQPVTSSEIRAQCRAATPAESQYFLEMLDEKGQTKLELTVEIAGKLGPAVSFKGSYVVLPSGSSAF